ncbi:hypothetical protein Hanom_Chr14g01325631 [Helianthus anomalus]
MKDGSNLNKLLLLIQFSRFVVFVIKMNDLNKRKKLKFIIKRMPSIGEISLKFEK